VAGDTELDRRILDAAGLDAICGGSADSLRRERYTHSFAEILELARSLGELITVARPLGPNDLVALPDVATAPPPLAVAQDASITGPYCHRSGCGPRSHHGRCFEARDI